jgi:hypothetical protein
MTGYDNEWLSAFAISEQENSPPEFGSKLFQASSEQRA